MATEEMKPETKITEHKQSAEVKNFPLPLPYKLCNLKVSVHCEGCKRKVKKILTSIEGVYSVDIDVKQQKVSVMGIASSEILLKKLLKSGKNAQLLPEIPNPEENKPVEPKEKNKKKKKVKTEITTASSSSSSDKPESEKPEAAEECCSEDGGEICAPVKEKKKDVLKEKCSIPADFPLSSDSSSPADSQSAAPTEEKKPENNSGTVGKKKKKKRQNISINNPNGGPVRTRSIVTPFTSAADQDRPINQNDVHDHIQTNNNPPRYDMYPYTPNYYAPQIMYGVSYNVAQPPVNVEGTSYYTSTPPYSYAYMHPGYLPSDQNPCPSRPSDSFELFNDENPNVCSVM